MKDDKYALSPKTGCAATKVTTRKAAITTTAGGTQGENAATRKIKREAAPKAGAATEAPQKTAGLATRARKQKAKTLIRTLRW